MEIEEYAANDATGLAELVRSGEVTAGELRDAAGRQHLRTRDAINAIVEWYEDPAPPAHLTGPLAGVPFLRKDLGSGEAGRLIEMGSYLTAGYRSPTTSPFYHRLAASGAQVLGRTAVPELGQHGTTETELFGATRNPIDTSTSVGGSSGGAAAAVRAGVVPVAHASDAAGSIRIPAAVTGLLGLKPTRGAVPIDGFDWRGLVSELVVARSVRDIAVCLDVLADPSVVTPDDPATAAGDRSLRIAVSAEHWAELATDPVTDAALAATVSALEDLGHRVEPIARPFDYEQLMTTWFPLFCGGVVDVIEWAATALDRPADVDHLEPNTMEMLAIVAGLEPDALGRARDTALAVGADLERAMTPYDLLLTPTLDRPVIPLGRMAGHRPMDDYLAEGDEWFDRLYLANVTGWPAMSLPAPVAGSTPIGIQLIARPGRERRLLAVADQLSDGHVIPAVTDPIQP